jgi:hypothetical protein
MEKRIRIVENADSTSIQAGKERRDLRGLLWKE